MQKNLIITNDWIKRRLKDYSPEQSISEYIENAIDAWAKNILINYEWNEIWAIDKFEIIDDGCGFSEKDLSTTFDVFLFSNKKKSLNHSNVFWKDWIGRLTFFCFALNTIRESYTKNETIKVSISWKDLSKYDILDIKKEENKKTWTKINFYNLNINKAFLDQKLPKELISRFSRIHYLKDIKILINWKELDFSEYVEKIENKDIKLKNYNFNIKFIKWKKALIEEESKNYFMKSTWEEVLKIWTSLNRQSDNFFHSVFITSNFFDELSLNGKWENFYFPNDEKWQNNRIIYREFIQELDRELNNFRRPFIKSLAKKYADENIQFKDTDSAIDKINKELTKNVIQELYLCEPKILTSLSEEQKNIFIQLVSTLLEEWNNNKLFDIIENVLKLTPEERLRFWNLVNEVSLGNITKTIEMIKSRLETIDLLHKLIFDKKLWTKENPDLQEVVSNNYWIFWEEYHLLAWTWEIKFQKLLRELLKFTDGWKKENKINHSNKNKEVDILLAKQERLTNKTKNVIVELKHPKKTLWLKEYTQIMGYFDLIYNNDQFNWQNFEWKFYLVGNKINEQIETLYENSRHHWDHVIHKDMSNWKNYTIYCYTRSDLLESNKQRLEYLKKSLELNLDNFNDEIDKIDNKEEIKTLLKNKQ